MDLGLKGKKILVTGGSDGIGRAAARLFAAEGAMVAIAARDPAKLEAARRDIAGDVLGFEADLTREADIARLHDQVMEKLGGIHVVICNAGGPPAGLATRKSDEDWLRAFELTQLSCVRLTRQFLPHLQAQKWGRIIIVSSTSVRVPLPNMALSNSIRLGVLGWAKTLANEVAADNVLINSVLPGWTRTARATQIVEAKARMDGVSPEAAGKEIAGGIPMGRMAEPEEVANMIVFLASERASYVTGTAIQVDGGRIGAI